MGTVARLVRTIVVMVIFLCFGNCSNVDKMVVAEESIRVYKDYPQSGPPSQDKVIAVLNQGETGDVIHIHYSKDFMFYKIKLKDGREGFVWFGDKFKVVPKITSVR